MSKYIAVFATLFLFCSSLQAQMTAAIAPPIPQHVNIAGEVLPMDNFDVYERFDRELISNSFGHSRMTLYMKRANKYFPTIERILKEEGVPDDFKYLAVAESGLSNATSPAGAKGIWQFMPATARSYGMIVNKEVDERYHLEKATRAACAYLKAAYKDFGSWTLAAASYNRGRGGIRSALNKQRVKSFYDLNITNETMRYIFRIAAIKTIMQSPDKYGFQIPSETLYESFPDYDTIHVKTSIYSLADFAVKNKVPYRMLKVYNPWMVSTRITNKSGRTYVVRLPKSPLYKLEGSK